MMDVDGGVGSNKTTARRTLKLHAFPFLSAADPATFCGQAEQASACCAGLELSGKSPLREKQMGFAPATGLADSK